MAKPDAIVPVSQDQIYVKWLLYGDPGVGKTVLAGTAPKCLILESGMDGSESAAIRGSTAEKWKMTDWQDMTDAYEYLRHDDHGFQWVVFDSITLFQELGLDNIMKDLVAEKAHRKLWRPDKGEFGENMNRLSLWTRDMKALPFNFVATAHVLRQEDEDSGDVTFMPAIQGRNMPQKFCGYFGLVSYMHVRRKEGKEERVLYTRKRARFYAKDRFDAFGVSGVVTNPTVPAMMEKIHARMPEMQRKRAAAAKKATAPTTARRRTA